MTALTKEIDVAPTGGVMRRVPLKAAAAPFAGALLGLHSGGYARPLVAGDPLAGVCEISIPTAPASDGDLMAQARAGLFTITTPVSGVTMADVFAATAIYASDDHTYTKTSSGNTKVGVVAGFDGTNTIIQCATADLAGALA